MTATRKQIINIAAIALVFILIRSLVQTQGIGVDVVAMNSTRLWNSFLDTLINVISLVRL